MLKDRKKGLLFAAICIVLVIVAVLLQIFPERTDDTGLPREVSELVENYMDALKTGTHKSVNYMHFESEFVRTAYVDTNDQLIDYKIESTKKINDNLYAITVQMKTENSLSRYGDVYRLCYNFAVRIDGKWYYLNGISHVPPELRENLNEDDYTYEDDEDSIKPEDILGALDFDEGETQRFEVTPR